MASALLQGDESSSERQAKAAEILSDVDERVIDLHEKFQALQRFEVSFTSNWRNSAEAIRKPDTSAFSLYFPFGQS